MLEVSKVSYRWCITSAQNVYSEDLEILYLAEGLVHNPNRPIKHFGQRHIRYFTQQGEKSTQQNSTERSNVCVTALA